MQMASGMMFIPSSINIVLVMSHNLFCADVKLGL
jgi:hypothetical protein